MTARAGVRGGDGRPTTMDTSPSRRRLRWVIALVGVAALAAVVLVLYTGYEGLKARQDLQRVASDLEKLSGQLSSGDQAGARHTLQHAQADAAAAHRHTAGPGWWLTSRIPVAGRNVTAVRTVAHVTDDLARTVLPDVVGTAGRIRPADLRPAKGRVDLSPLEAVTPQVVRASAGLAAQSARVQAIDTSALAGPVAQPVAEMQARLAKATALSDRMSRAVRLLPPMLGSRGPRTYLLMFQNNAEVRSTGGIPGSFATITARHGKLSFGDQGDAGTAQRLDRPPLPLTAEERTLFGETMGVYPQDVNFTPDFPRSARLLQAMWRASGGGHVDGVVSADPVALSHLLGGTGQVALEDGSRLTATNAVPLLLNEVYGRIADPAEQNDYFESVARSVFKALASGQGRPKAMIANLSTSVDEHRVMLWSEHPAEQALIAPTALAGAQPTKPSAAPQVGVFLNDGGASKLDYYLDYAVDVESTGCRAGRQRLTTTLHLRSRVPAGATLPAYVANNAEGLPPKVIQLTVYAYAPIGGTLTSAAYDGHDRGLANLRQGGRPVTVDSVAIRPGARHTLTFTMLSGKGQTGRPALRVTPGVRSDGVGSVSRSSC